MPVPYTFGSATSAIPLSQLDANFATTITLGNTAIQLGNTVTTLNNMTLANVTISSGSVTITSATVTSANVTSTLTLSGLTASTALALDASKNVVSVTNTGTGNNVLATSPTLVTPVLGTPTSGTLTNCTGYPTSALSGNINLATQVTGTLGTTNGGTGLTSFTSGGAVYATSTSALTTGTLPTTAGGTGLTSFTANGVVYASSSSALTTGSALSFDGSFLGLNRSTAWASEQFGISGSSASQRFIYARSTSAGHYLSFGTNGAAPYIEYGNGAGLIFQDGASEQMRLTSTGLGIGTSLPATKLQVVGTATFGDGTNGQIRLTSNSSLNYFDSLNNAASAWQTITQRATVFDWFTAASGTPSTGMRLDSSGNLGIGTSSPSGIFNIKTSNGQFLVQNGTSANQMRISAFNNAGNANAALIFEGYSSEYGRFDSSGNLGLGVTPSASQFASFRVLQINTQGAIASGSGVTNYTHNAYFNAAGTPKYLSSGFANRFVQRSDTGAMEWYNAPSWNGTGSDTISFTQAMTLDASGNLLVGDTTNPGGRFYMKGGYARFSDGTYTGLFGKGSDLVTGGGTADLAVRSDGAILFSYGSTERARITSGGDLLVGTTDSSATSGAGTKLIANGQYYGVMAASTNSDTTLQVYSTGAAAYRFYVGLGGTVYATNTTISAISDQRFKENIVDLDVGLNAVMALKPRKFDWKSGKGKDIKGDRGFIAQEFEQVFPDLIDEWKDPAPESEEPYKSVRQDLIPVLVKAIQEQQAIITDLRARVAQLEAK